MNKRMVISIVGRMLMAEALLMAPAAILSAFYGERALWALLASMAIAATVGWLCMRARPADATIFARDGFMVVALSWVALSLTGALPFYFSGEIPRFVDAFFESVSGLTTTGASILTDVERMSKGLLYWRSFTHWIGGMGVLVFVMAVVPLAGSRSMHLMRAEVAGPQVGKLVPKLKHTALILYGIYMAMTVILVILLYLGGMPLLDSVLNAYGTVGTGGFGIRNTSIAAYNSVYIDTVITIFMVLSGVNFSLFYLVLTGQTLSVLKNEELRYYLGIYLVSALFITLNILPQYESFGQAIRYATFQAASIQTTTGFTTANYDAWPEFSKAILLILMFIGASAGSTAGGLKISRMLILFRSIRAEIRRLLHPRSVTIVRINDRRVDGETSQAVHVYFSLYIALLFAAYLLVSLDGFDFETTFTAVAACFNNIGPGMGLAGPTGSFAMFSPLSKLVLSFAMLLGRLEILPLLLLFSPSVWRNASLAETRNPSAP